MSKLFCPPGHLLLQPEAASQPAKPGFRVVDAQDRQLRRATILAAPLDWSGTERGTTALLRPQDAENPWKLQDGTEVVCVEVSRVVAFEA